ncbi:MAG TPA: hypothetical protein V6C57_10135, partial [Coleofasciculaceae cyanobacterium]
MILPSFKTQFPALRWWAVLVGGLILLDVLSFWVAEGLWFQEVNYLPVFQTRLLTQVSLGFVGFALSLG